MEQLTPTRTAGLPRKPRLGLDRATGLLRGARQVESPNWDERPPGVLPDLILIHGISLPPGQFGGHHIDALFTNTLDPAGHPYFRDVASARVSSHVLIRRDGEVVQYVPFHRRAWHAGRSSFKGRERCNDFSVGIELEGTDDRPYAAAQYRRLALLIRLLRRGVPSLRTAPVVGHSDVAPGRKTDPGPAFDWPRLRRLVDRPTRPGAPDR